MAELTTTSYAILGLLTLRPHSAYDLTQQARRSLAFIWPISESQLYAEPRRLVGEGLVKATKEPAGPTRTRTTYRITAKGRRAFAGWLRTAPAAPGHGSEILLRVAFADAGDQKALLASIAACREAVSARYEAGRHHVGEQLAGTAPYPERASLNTVWWVLIGEQLRLTLGWLAWAEGEVRAWDGTQPHALDDRLRALAERLVAGEAILRTP